MFSLGISMIPTSPGMFLRDVGDSIGIVTTAMLLLPWIFYPLAAYSLAAFGEVWAGSIWFQKTRKCFSDVL
jgi:lipopolysaccharide transport system permease protein